MYFFHNHSLYAEKMAIRDCAIIIRRGGAEKLEGGHYIKLLPRWEGSQSKITHLTEGGP